MGRELKAFLSQRKVEDLCFFEDQYLQSGVFLFPATNKDEEFFWKYTFQKYLPSFEISIAG